MKSVFSNRKVLYLVLSIVCILIFTLTIAYAALNTVLKITGNAEVVASSWDIRLENAVVKNGSVNSNVPTISNNTTASFSATLTNPGDYYAFTIDIVNKGSIDAMVDSVEKLPSLTSEQAKYLNYIIEYENGENISTRQLVKSNSFVRLKVKIEYRKDLVASDLPNTNDSLNLSFSVKFVQSDGSVDNTLVENNGVFNPVKMINGNVDTVGSEVCIGSECFQIISSDNSSVTLFSMMNISLESVPKQTSMFNSIKFSDSAYWNDNSSSYPAYVYNDNSNLYEYVENYKKYLEGTGIVINEARLLSIEELFNLAVCDDPHCFFKNGIADEVSFWTGSAKDGNQIYYLYDDGEFGYDNYEIDYDFGIRPVIVISKEYF